MQKKHRGLPITGALHLQRSLGCPEVSPRLGGPWGNRWGFALMIRPVLQAGQPRGWAAHLKVRHGRAAVRALMGLLDGLEEVSEHLQVAAGPRIHGSIVWVLLAPAGGMGCPPKQGSWSGLAPRPPRSLVTPAARTVQTALAALTCSVSILETRTKKILSEQPDGYSGEENLGRESGRIQSEDADSIRGGRPKRCLHFSPNAL